ncbi:hypothetical protein pb186bvf_011238 [Paramecium bursaria]
MHNKSFLRTIFDRPIENLKIGNTVKTLQNKESLMLYRDILKFSNEFYWKNQNGDYWRDIIRKSARKEFELARDERDPILVMKMIVTSREAMQSTREKLIQEYYKMNNSITEDQKEQNNFFPKNT